MPQSSAKFDTPPRDLTDPAPNVTGTGSWGTARYQAANTAELYYDSLQYEGLANWDAEIALRRKKPREIIPLFKTAVDTIHSFIWGGARQPRVTVAATRTDDQDDSDEIGPRLWEDDATALTTFVQEMVRSARLDRCAAEYSRKALVTSSCAVLLCCKNGRLVYYVEDGKHCTPAWSDENPRQLDSLDICYQYPAQEQIPGTQGFRIVNYWFRRIIDDQNDTVFMPVKVTGAPPIWIVDTSQSVKHGLGFCPAVWVRTLPMSGDSIDGCPIIDPVLYKLLDRVNYVYSLLGRSAEYNLDPQWVRKNVSQDARVALQKAPSKIWDIEDSAPEKEADIKLLEAQGSGAETGSALLADLRKRFTEACRVVIADPESVQGRNVSGVVLEYLHAPMISLASDLRKDLGDDALGDLINLALRIVCVVTARGEDVYIQGTAKAVKLMMTAQLGGPWLEFPVRLQWGRFFSPTVQDIGLAVQAAVQAKQGGLVGQEAATRLVADLFGVVDVGAEVDTLTDEKQQAMQDAITQAQATAKVMGPPQPPGKQAPPNQQQQKPKQAQKPGAPKP